MSMNMRLKHDASSNPTGSGIPLKSRSGFRHGALAMTASNGCESPLTPCTG